MPKSCRKTQVGCSKKRRTGKTGKKSRRNFFTGGDAFNEIPARYIYPLNNNILANPVNARITGGKRQSRKYLKKVGGSNSWNPLAYQQQPIAEKYNMSNRFLV